METRQLPTIYRATRYVGISPVRRDYGDDEFEENQKQGDDVGISPVRRDYGDGARQTVDGIVKKVGISPGAHRDYGDRPRGRPQCRGVCGRHKPWCYWAMKTSVWTIIVLKIFIVE